MIIHPSSVVSKEAELADDVVVGPFCIVHGRVKIGAGTRLGSHVSVGSDHGVVEIGRNNQICAGAALGGPPQDIHYKNEPTKLLIGDDNMIREFTTINIGTAKGGGVTKIGNQNLIMAYAHVGHDVHIGDQNTMVNSVQIAGHVRIDKKCTISGMCGINQNVRIGSYSFIAGYSSVNKDILPYTMAYGNHAVCRATNKVGLERNGFAPNVIEDLHRAIRIIVKGSSTIAEGLQRIQAECGSSPELDYFVDFIKSSKRGIAK